MRSSHGPKNRKRKEGGCRVGTGLECDIDPSATSGLRNHHRKVITSLFMVAQVHAVMTWKDLFRGT
jgi:hypothetical protein